MAQAVWDASRFIKSLAASATVILSDTGTSAQAASGMTVSAEARRRVSSRGPRDAFYILLPLIVVMSTFLFLMLVFLICVLLLRRRRGIALRDSDGPVDVSREDLIQGEGGFEGVEERWLETVSEQERREYLRAKTWQSQYPPNSQPTDITLSQFLSIQEKGVSAWSFEPDYETISSVLVHARTEVTFLPDPESSSCVQSNLPLPKLNEVYYWEVKCFDLPTTTNIAVGLATKPYPPFRLPGHCRHSVAYHSNGDKSFNWPFTSSTFFSPLKEGDVLGLGYRPRSGTVFYTRNGRKTEDAFVGLNRWNLFPTVGADGPCSLHVNLGQSGFVFIEANVKKWGLAPSVGTLAPPPAYGSERGSILLAAGGNIQSTDDSAVAGSPPGPSSHSSRSSRRHRTRRPRSTQPSSSTAPVASSPLRTSSLVPNHPVPRSPPPPITPIDEEMETSTGAGPSSSSSRYLSPTDMPYHTPANTRLPSSPMADSPPVEEVAQTPEERDGAQSPQSPSGSSSRSSSPSPPPPADTDGAGAGYFNMTRRRAHSSTTSSNPFLHSRTHNRSRSEAIPAAIPVHHGPLPDTPLSPNPPTPNAHDIDLGAWTPRRPGSSSIRDRLSGAGAISRTAAVDAPPPSYSPLDPYAYADGVRIDLPASVIAAAMEGAGIPESAIGASNTRAERRSRREGRSGR